MIDNKTLGVHCLKDNKFYYMETGNIKLTNPVSRILKALTMRNLIAVVPGTLQQERQYDIFTAEKAKLQGMEMRPIYLNSHVKDMIESGEAQKEEKAGGHWGKK